MKKIILTIILFIFFANNPLFAQVPPQELKKIKELKTYLATVTKTKINQSILNYSDPNYQEHQNICKNTKTLDTFQNISGGSLLCTKNKLSFWFAPTNSQYTYQIAITGSPCSVILKHGYASLLYNSSGELQKALFKIGPKIRAIFDKKGKLELYQYNNIYLYEENSGNIKGIPLGTELAEKYFNLYH